MKRQMAGVDAFHRPICTPSLLLLLSITKYNSKTPKNNQILHFTWTSIPIASTATLGVTPLDTAKKLKSVNKYCIKAQKTNRAGRVSNNSATEFDAKYRISAAIFKLTGAALRLIPLIGGLLVYATEVTKVIVASAARNSDFALPQKW